MDKQIYLLDTNVILRLILKDNQDQYKKIMELLEQAESGYINLECSFVSIFETAFVLLGKTYEISKNDTVKILNTVLNIRLIDFEKKESILKALEIYDKNTISIMDSYLLAESTLNNKQFFSFDAKANKTFKQLQTK